MPPAATSTRPTSTTPRWIRTSSAPAAASPTTRGATGFYSIKPGAYPWRNHPNGWRPNHIHFSLFGPSFATRLVTQMYFPGDPLLELDPVYQGAPKGARERLIARFSIDVTEPEFALGYVFDIVLRGREETPMES